MTLNVLLAALLVAVNLVAGPLPAALADDPPAVGEPCRAHPNLTQDLGVGDDASAVALMVTPVDTQFSLLSCDVAFHRFDGSLCDLLKRTTTGVGPLLVLVSPLKVNDACDGDLAYAVACTTVWVVRGTHQDLRSYGCVRTTLTTSAQVNRFPAGAFDVSAVDTLARWRPTVGAIVMFRNEGDADVTFEPLGLFKSWTCKVTDHFGRADADLGDPSARTSVTCWAPDDGNNWFCAAWAVVAKTHGRDSYARGTGVCDNSNPIQTAPTSGDGGHATAVGVQAGSTVPVRWARCSAYDPASARVAPSYLVVCFEPPLPSVRIVR